MCVRLCLCLCLCLDSGCVRRDVAGKCRPSGGQYAESTGGGEQCRVWGGFQKAPGPPPRWARCRHCTPRRLSATPPAPPPPPPPPPAPLPPHHAEEGWRPPGPTPVRRRGRRRPARPGPGRALISSPLLCHPAVGVPSCPGLTSGVLRSAVRASRGRCTMTPLGRSGERPLTRAAVFVA